MSFGFSVGDFIGAANLTYKLIAALRENHGAGEEFRAAIDEERCRTGCDLMNLSFVIDEYSDVSGEAEVREQKNVVMDALRNPHIPRPKGEWIGGEVARQSVNPYSSVCCEISDGQIGFGNEQSLMLANDRSSVSLILLTSI